MLLIKARASNCFAELGAEGVALSFGWWSDTIRYDEIESVEPGDWSWYLGYGMRIGPDKTLGLIGSGRGIVYVNLAGPRTFKVPFTLEHERIALSLNERDRFMDELKTRLQEHRPA